MSDTHKLAASLSSAIQKSQQPYFLKVVLPDHHVIKEERGVRRYTLVKDFCVNMVVRNEMMNFWEKDSYIYSYRFTDGEIGGMQ